MNIHDHVARRTERSPGISGSAKDSSEFCHANSWASLACVYCSSVYHYSVTKIHACTRYHRECQRRMGYPLAGLILGNGRCTHACRVLAASKKKRGRGGSHLTRAFAGSKSLHRSPHTVHPYTSWTICHATRMVHVLFRTLPQRSPTVKPPFDTLSHHHSLPTFFISQPI